MFQVQRRTGIWMTAVGSPEGVYVSNFQHRWTLSVKDAECRYRDDSDGHGRGRGIRLSGHGLRVLKVAE